MIEIKNICSGYGKDNVLRGLSLSIAQGEVLSVVGLNGCGKSTLLKTVARIIPPRGGDIYIDGVSVKELTPKERARRIAYLPQTKPVPDMTVEELVLQGRFPHTAFPYGYRQNDKSAAYSAIEKMGISELSGSSLSSLSGGMLQRAYIAMALCQSADYILLDEPTTHLDASASLELMELLRGLAGEGKGIAVVMHDLALAFEYSDRVALLLDGKIIKEGAPEDLYRSGIVTDTFGVGLLRAPNGSYYYDRSNRR